MVIALLLCLGCNSEFSDNERAMINAATLKDKLPYAMRLCEINPKRAEKIILKEVFERNVYGLPRFEMGEFDFTSLELAYTVGKILYIHSNVILRKYIYDSKSIDDGLKRFYNIIKCADDVSDTYDLTPGGSFEENGWFGSREEGRAYFEEYMPKLSFEKFTGTIKQYPKFIFVYRDNIDREHSFPYEGWHTMWYIDLKDALRSSYSVNKNFFPDGLDDIDILITIERNHFYQGYWYYPETGEKHDSYDQQHTINAYDYRSGKWIQNISTDSNSIRGEVDLPRSGGQ
jgi:hypothetical protein